MKTLLVLALSFLAAVPSYGAVVPTDGTDLLIPVAGFAAGSRGEVFQTDLTLVNLSRNSQAVRLSWLPQGGTASPQTETVVLEGFTYRTLLSVVETTFRTSGVGAILIQPVDGNNPSANAAIDAEARIWTESICGSIPGTVSQSVPSINLDSWSEMSPAYIHGVVQNLRFRTNYGIVNISSNPIDFRVLINSRGGRIEQRVTVPAYGTIHRAVPAGVQADLSIYIEPVGSPVLTPPTSRTWRAYGTTTDNQSGSGWTVIAMQPRTDVQF